MKFDGYRAQAAISGSEVVVYTRNGHDWTRQFKVILPPLQALTRAQRSSMARSWPSTARAAPTSRC
ncbi:hypothetical protein [Mesorhizobium sp.]|uniref:hypothetical protein n=1 Tax=Mesorhizobium sp. TaxID=1871066 RepID=UPI0025FAD845|nr:hypothetical protein [Mesorhizobium sp.]